MILQESQPSGSIAVGCVLSEAPAPRSRRGGSWPTPIAKVSGSREQLARFLFWAMLLGGLLSRLEQQVHLQHCFDRSPASDGSS